MPETAAERREHARKANRHRQLREPSGTAMTAAARRAAEDRFTARARQEHPGASERDIQRMAKAARDLFYDELSAAGVAARQARAAVRKADTTVRAFRRAAEKLCDDVLDIAACDDLAV